MPTLERTGSRILRDTAADIELQVYVGGVATAPDASPAPTVTVTDAAGVVIVDAATATISGTKAKYTLSPALTADVAVLTATWTLSVGGVAAQVFETKHQVVGALLFSVAAARAFDSAALADSTKYPDAMLIEGRDRISESFEQVCGVPFGLAYGREVLDGNATDELWLAGARIQRVRSIKVRTAGTQIWTPLTSDELADLLVDRNGRMMREVLGVFAYGRRNVAIEYEHGWQPIPDEVSRAALWLLRSQLVGSDLPANALSQSSELGTFSLSVPGVRGSYYGLPQVDEVVKRYSQRLPAFA